MLVVLEADDGEIGVFPVEEMKTLMIPFEYDEETGRQLLRHHAVERGDELITYTKVIAFAGDQEVAQFWIDKYEGGEFTPDVNYMI